MAWSEQQLAAINTANKNLLVAAAAGSGKTSVLVERIIQKILNEDEKLNIDQVLVLTFTNAAATEMRERIAGAITKALTENHNSKHLEKQLVLLNMAAISKKQFQQFIHFVKILSSKIFMYLTLIQSFVWLMSKKLICYGMMLSKHCLKKNMKKATLNF